MPLQGEAEWGHDQISRLSSVRLRDVAKGMLLAMRSVCELRSALAVEAKVEAMEGATATPSSQQQTAVGEARSTR